MDSGYNLALPSATLYTVLYLRTAKPAIHRHRTYRVFNNFHRINTLADSDSDPRLQPIFKVQQPGRTEFEPGPLSRGCLRIRRISCKLLRGERVHHSHPSILLTVVEILGVDRVSAQSLGRRENGRVPVGNRESFGLLDGDTH